MPNNETGYELTIGPDKDGQHFTVQPGDPFEWPDPPATADPGDTSAAEDTATGPAADLAKATADAARTSPTRDTTTDQHAETTQDGDTHDEKPE